MNRIIKLIDRGIPFLILRNDTHGSVDVCLCYLFKNKTTADCAYNYRKGALLFCEMNEGERFYFRALVSSGTLRRVYRDEEGELFDYPKLPFKEHYDKHTPKAKPQAA